MSPQRGRRRAQSPLTAAHRRYDIVNVLESIGVIEALDLARATMAKVRQNLSWAVSYNVVAIPVAAGVLLPSFDFAMTPSLSGGLMAFSSIFVVGNASAASWHSQQVENRQPHKSIM